MAMNDGISDGDDDFGDGDDDFGAGCRWRRKRLAACEISVNCVEKSVSDRVNKSVTRV
jgi:hypothetical protein